MPKLLDLFCGAGGAGMGYNLAGFDVVGVDIAPQPHYPFEFYQSDAFVWLSEHWQEFDAIHASPPCQGYSVMRHLPWLKNREYPLLIDAIRAALNSTGKTWVIENVATAPLHGGELCGLALGLPLLRHRRFESNILLLFPQCPGHPVLFPENSQMSQRGRKGGIMGVLPGYEPRQALDCEWMTLREARQAIPPAYTKFIGEQLINHIAEINLKGAKP